MLTPELLALERQRQENNQEFEASLGYDTVNAPKINKTLTLKHSPYVGPASFWLFLASLCRDRYRLAPLGHRALNSGFGLEGLAASHDQLADLSLSFSGSRTPVFQEEGGKS